VNLLQANSRISLYKDVQANAAERIVGAAKPFRRNEAERRNPEKPGFCWKQKAAQNEKKLK